MMHTQLQKVAFSKYQILFCMYHEGFDQPPTLAVHTPGTIFTTDSQYLKIENSLC